VDRLDNLRTTGMRFSPRELPAADAVAFVRAGIDNLPTRRRVEALVHAPAERVRSLVGRWASIDEADDSSCRLRMTVENLDWPALTLAMIGADFEVIRPVELVERIRELGERFTRATSEPGSNGA
jgi:predicted DNA-binding transcriptional regulator YafY